MQQHVAHEVGQGDTARRRKTRERLLEAAYEVFAETGVHASSVEAITERAGFTRGAFYSNFDSKEELFFALAEREMLARFNELQQGIDEILPGLDATSATDSVSVSDIVTSFLNLQMDDRRWTLMQSEFRLHAMRDISQAARFLEYQHDFRLRLAERLDAALASVGLKFIMDSVDATRMIIDVCESAMQESILSNDKSPNVATSPYAVRTLPLVIIALTTPL
ncbi:TetR/AcrR family transcriptional regulator [Leifsonia sp. A12D58]|uniref:TetR/AcrR family transcriptional regulator n=1 Tax=Leifsonia sp. A12D58 TaxID=3397674 RepID=UPI0039E017BE